MKFKMPKIHTQILLALIFGAIFGSIFNVNQHLLLFGYKENNVEKIVKIKDWKELTFKFKNGDEGEKTFIGKQQLEIIAYFKKLGNERKNVDVEIKDFTLDDKGFRQSMTFTNVVSISKQETIATEIKWIGDIFIRLLSMIAVPLVLASLTVGAASLGNVKKFARIGGKTLAFYLTTTAFAITIGLVIANVIQPGTHMSPDTKERLISAYSGDASSKLENVVNYSIADQIVEMVPKNPVHAIANSQMLQIVFFALMLGLMLNMISKKKAESVIGFFDGLSDAMIKMVDVIMYMAPIGVFALISATIGEFGFDILQTLIWYAIAVLLGLLIHTFGTYALILKIFTKLKIFTFYKAIRRVQTIGFSTSSSAATLPVNMECCQDNLGVSKSITSFVLPLGATINMDGTALYQGVAAVFIAQVFGMHLTIAQQLTIVFTATLASIGTAPVPGVGLIMLIIILKSVGIPEVGIALILGVDRILDMSRTVTNVTGDATATVVIASSEKEILHPDLENA